MDDEKFQELKKNLALAKKTPLNFAFALGSGKNENVCEMHRKLPLNKLRQMAKKEAGSNKIICGVASVEGKLLSVTCEEEPARPLVKALKKFLIDIKLKHKIQILDLDGSVLVDDEEDTGPQTSAEPGADVEDDIQVDEGLTPEELEVLNEQFAKLKQLAQTVSDRKPAIAASLTAATDGIRTLIDARDVDRARAAMAKLATVLRKQNEDQDPKTDTQAVSAAIKKLLQLRNEIDDGYSNLMSVMSKHEDEQIRRIATDGHQKIFGGAGGVLDGIETDLFAAVAVWNKAKGDDRSAAEDEIRHCVKRLRTHLSSDKLIGLLENNPFGATLQIAQPLTSVLSEIDEHLA